MWAGHFAVFPGDVPALVGERFNEAAVILLLSINLLTPLLLTFALVQRGGPLARPATAIVTAIVAGAVLGLLMIGFALTGGSILHPVSSTGEFAASDALVGIAGLIPAAFGLVAYFIALH